MKYYKRDGRRFTQIENLYGMYANWDETYSKERRGNSYGVVVIHNFKEIVIAHLAVVSNKTWYEAKKGYKLPSRLQLTAAFELKHMFDQSTCRYWTNEEHFTSNNWAWYVYWRDGFTDYDSKLVKCYVREFTTIKL